MKADLRPLAGALGIALVVAAGGAAIVLEKHSGHPHSGGLTPVAVTGGLITLAPDPPSTPTPSMPPQFSPATGVAVIWATVPGDDQILQAFDWSGTPRGRFTLPAPAGQLGEPVPSPDGQRLLISGPDSASHVYAAQGGEIGRVAVDPSVARSLQWAGDDSHLCGLLWDTNLNSAKLVTATVGGPVRTVATMRWPEGNGGPRLDACNARSDLAVLSVALGDDAAGHVVEYRVIRLSTGATLRDVHPPAPDFSSGEPRPVPGALWNVDASADGRQLLLMPYTGEMEVHPQTWQILDSVSGGALGHFTASTASFVGDGHLVLVDRALLDWRTGHRVPTPPNCCSGVDLARPGGDDLVTSIPTGPPPTPSTSSAAPPPAPPDDYVILRPDGSTVKLTCCGATVVSAPY